MTQQAITTERLTLIPSTLELAEAELSGDHDLMGRLLGAKVQNWPPPLNDEESMTWNRDFLAEHPDAVGWSSWYVVLRGETPLLIGNAGFKGGPRQDGSVEIGYSLLEAYQRRGYITEAVRALVDWAFSHPEVRGVVAHTFPELLPSIKVLRKVGFSQSSHGASEPGAIRFSIRREDRLAKRP